MEGTGFIFEFAGPVVAWRTQNQRLAHTAPRYMASLIDAPESAISYWLGCIIEINAATSGDNLLGLSYCSCCNGMKALVSCFTLNWRVGDVPIEGQSDGALPSWLNIHVIKLFIFQITW